MNTRSQRELVLVGGGHTHVQILRQLTMKPRGDLHLTLVVDTPIAVYSGMVPGFAAGQYSAAEIEIDVVPLARQAGARVILARAVGIDAPHRRIALEGRPDIAYDLASFDIGSTVAGLDLPGIRQHSLPTRPIASFVRRIDELLVGLRQRSQNQPLRVVVVGGGAGGVELAFTLRQRLLAETRAAVEVSLLQAGRQLLPDYPDGLRQRVEHHAQTAGIEVRCDTRVAAAHAGEVELEGGERLATDLLLWVTGAISQPIFRNSGLPTDRRGFVKIRSTLQVVGHDELFAVGDCATMIEHPDTAKAGVYAVRQGPYLGANLRAALDGRPLRPYRPQRDFLTLLNLGNGEAIGGKRGFSFAGAWVMRLKDWIDRRFMRRFQVLDGAGRLLPLFADMAQMDDSDEPMACGGCAAKIGQSVLTRALDRLRPGTPDPSVVLGLETPDDAAVVVTPGGDLLVSSIDAFRAFTDDPYLVGRVAAVNALSDLWATGVETTHALALVALPAELDDATSEEVLVQILAGATAVFEPLGVTLLGGHTISAGELLVGFQVSGLAPSSAPLLRIDALLPGQALLLTKPLGTGVLLQADMRGRARGSWLESTLASLQLTNQQAAQIALRHGARGATDITGFGLAGHLGEMLQASGLSARLEVDRLPALPGALELLEQGIKSTFHDTNTAAGRRRLTSSTKTSNPRSELLFDPQTSGGLLIGLNPAAASSAIAELQTTGHAAATVIGHTCPARSDGALIELV